MNYQSYEDYMNSVLGRSYPREFANPIYNYPYITESKNISTYTNPTIPQNVSDTISANSQGIVNTTPSNIQESEQALRIKKMYPDIYYLLMPMINKIVVENKNKEITENLIETLTMEVYNNFEEDMLNYKNTTSKTTTSQTSSTMTPTLKLGNMRQSSQLTNTLSETSPKQGFQINGNNQHSQLTNSRLGEVENSRKIGNPILKDLIRILIINKLIEELTLKPLSSLINNEKNSFMSQNAEMNNGYNNMYGSVYQTKQTMNPFSQMRQNNLNEPFPRINYPFTNYFASPYPEDERAN